MKTLRPVHFFIYLVLSLTATLAGLTNCGREKEIPPQEEPELTEDRGQLIGENLPRSVKQVYWSRAGDEIIARCSPGVFAVNIETDSVRPIDKSLETVYANYSKDGKYLIYVAKAGQDNQYKIGKLDLIDGSSQVLIKNSVAGPLIISGDHNKIAFLITGIPDPSIFIYTESTDNVQPFAAGIPRAFNPDGTKMIVRDEKDQKIYLINLDDHTKTDLKLDMIYKYKYFWNGDRIFAMANGRIVDVFNNKSKTTNLKGVLGRSWTRSMTFDYHCVDELCSQYYVTYYLINDSPYLKEEFATAIAYNFGYPTFAPDEQHAAYIVDDKIYICKLPF